MLIKLQLKKNYLSNWLLLFFLVILIGVAIVSDLFQTPTFVGHDLNQYKFLFDKDELKSISGIEITNNLTNVAMENQKSHWQMTSPKNLPANEETIKKIISTLEAIKIKEVHTLDPINISHFSLDTPLTQIAFKFESANAVLKMKFGLINPIDNSTYVTLSDKEAIYQVEAIKSPLESIDLAEFIESRLFPFDNAAIKQIEIYKGVKKQNILQVALYSKNDVWVDKSNVEQNSELVNQFLLQLTSVKSYMILDFITQEQRTIVDDYLNNVAYTVSMVVKDKEFIFYVTNIINGIADLKIEKRQHFIVVSENKIMPYLVNKEMQNVFLKRQSEFTKNFSKKLFD